MLVVLVLVVLSSPKYFLLSLNNNYIKSKLSVDSDLHLRIDPVTFTSAKPLSHEIFSLVWSGARANYGVREGKVCYEVRLSEETQLARNHQFRNEPHIRGFRVGFSLPQTSLLVGEAANSFAYCDSGRKANKSEFADYGKPFQLDDVIGCYLDLDSTPCTIKYTLNGEDLGVAFEFDKSILGETDALFPHILTKGYEFQVNFADNENLLVNVERHTRKRRKPRKEPSPEKEETLTDSNQDSWKIVDEAKPDDEDDKIKSGDKSDGVGDAADDMEAEAKKPEPTEAAADSEQKKVEEETKQEEAEKKQTEEKPDDAVKGKLAEVALHCKN